MDVVHVWIGDGTGGFRNPQQFRLHNGLERKIRVGFV